MSPFDCRPLTATSVSPHREEQTWGQMPDSRRAVKLKKKSMNRRIYGHTSASFSSRFSMRHSRTTRACSLRCIWVFGSAVPQKPRRSRRRKHVILHADGQTGLSVLQTCFIERDATIGWAETVVKTKTLKKTLSIPDHIRSEPAGQDRGVPIIVCFNGSNTSGWDQGPN